MYTVVDFKLPEGLSLQIGPINDFFSFEPQEGECNRKLSIPVPDSGGQSISLMKYLVGETIHLRKSLHGIRMIKGLPDYSGYVERIGLGPHIPQMADTLKRRHIEYQNRLKDREGGRTLFQSNLCQEIVLPASYDPYQSLRDRLSWPTRTPNRNEASRRLTDLPTAGDFDGDIRGVVDGDTGGIMDFETYLTRPRTSGPRGDFEQLQHYMTYSRNFTGLTTSRRLDRLEVPGPAPEYSPTPTAPVSLARAADAVAEVVTGQRGTPPASRGPRPRNQRW